MGLEIWPASLLREGRAALGLELLGHLLLPIRVKFGNLSVRPANSLGLVIPTRACDQ